MFTAFRVTVSNVAISLNTVNWDDEDERTYIVRNGGAGDIILGDSAVTPSNGYFMASGDVRTFNINPHDIMYAIRAAATDAVVHIIKI